MFPANEPMLLTLVYSKQGLLVLLTAHKMPQVIESEANGAETLRAY